MAKKQEESLLGYDPLAWMNEEPQGEEVSAAQEQEQVASATEHSSNAQVTQENQLKVVLEAVQNIQNVANLREEIISKLENSLGAIEIDASAVNSIDTATLQLFVALKKETDRLERVLVFDFPSERFLEAANLIGVSKLLELDKSASGFF